MHTGGPRDVPDSTMSPSRQAPRFFRSDTEQSESVKADDNFNVDSKRKHLLKGHTVSLDDVTPDINDLLEDKNLTE
jgi:hypothetical protein